tara:strand:+ start:2308 stop:3141 length:834 start_codon:yes stop_codon:yes gene_type:complete
MFNTLIKNSDILKKVIFLNILIFIFIKLIKIFISPIYHEQIINVLALSSNFEELSKSPWKIVSYMFIHHDIFHLTTNLLLLYFFGSIYVNYLSEKKFLSTYLFGGVVGALFFILAFNFFSEFEEIKNKSIAIGGSASVLAIIFSISGHIPNYKPKIYLIGKIKLKYLALLVLFMDILNIPSGNIGGHIAHIGGAFYGYLNIKLLNKYKINTSAPIEKIFDFVKKNKIQNHKKNESDYDYNARKKREQEKIDNILDKINTSGYDSLSDEDKRTLSNDH